ncbi:MAG: hypothetical protein AB1467_07070 [Candidatus Diapherotrites archaeon]
MTKRLSNMKVSSNRRRQWWWDYSPWVIGGLVILTGNCAANSLWETLQALITLIFEGKWGSISLTGILALFLFLISACILYKKVKERTRLHTRKLYKEDPAELREHLVLFISEPKDYEQPSGIPPGLVLSGKIEKDLKAIEDHKKVGPRWTWEMPFRALMHHLGKSPYLAQESKLKTVTLLFSQQSILFRDKFLECFCPYAHESDFSFNVLLKQKGKPELFQSLFSSSPDSRHGWDFEHFDELSEALWYLLKKFDEQQVPENEIMLDFTGGQKPSSAVAVAMTFNSKIKAQYIQTNPPMRAISYDLFYGITDTGGFGKIWA